MILALMAMCMGTQVMAQTPMLVSEIDWTPQDAYYSSVWYSGNCTVSVNNGEGLIINSTPPEGAEQHQPQVPIIAGIPKLYKNGQYQLKFTVDAPAAGEIGLDLCSWDGTGATRKETINVKKGLYEYTVDFPDFPDDCTSAMLFYQCGYIPGTHVIKKVELWEITPIPEGSEPYAVYTASDHTFTFYYDNNKGEGAYSLNAGYSSPAWHGTSICSQIQKVKFTDNFKYARPTSTYQWFSDFENLKTIEDIQYLNTSALTNMCAMFELCKSLENLDLSSFDTDNVTDMSHLFSVCSSLKDLNVSSFNTERVTNMHQMFNGCYSLTSLIWGKKFITSSLVDASLMFSNCQSLPSIDLKRFDTHNVTNMYNMFANCSSLTILNLTNFDTSNVTNMEDMFSHCYNLKRIFVGNGWNTGNVTRSNDMFLYCNSLEGEQETLYDEEYIGVQRAHIDGGTNNPGYLSAYPTAYAVFNGSTLTFYNDGRKGDKAGTAYLLNVEGFPDWNGSHPEITKVVFDESFATSRPIKTNNWFEGFSGLLEIEGIENLNTSKVMDMTAMFSVCSKLKSLDLSSFDTRNVTSMSCMFLNCRKLTSLNLSGFNTAKVTAMKMMFSGCIELTVLDLTSFDTSNVTDMGYMFSSSPYLETICVGNGWNTASVTESQSLFGGCNKLVGENGTTYSNANTNNVDFAHIDVEGNPGYLSSLKLYNLWIADEQVTIINKNNIGGGCFSYNPKENILTINDSFTSDNDARPTLRNDIPDLTIYVPSDVTIESTARNTMFLKASTTITGPGTLQVVSTKSEGIWVNDGSTLTITDANLEVNGVWGICGAYSDHNTQEKLLVNHSNVSITSRSTDTGAIIDMRGGIELNNCEITIPAVYTFEDGAVKEGSVLAQNVVITATKPSITTDIDNGLLSKGPGQRDGWYTIDGRKLNGKPTKKGVYINNGKAVVR